MDKVKDLMEVRYKVIADYPKSLYNVGDILKSGWRSEDCIYCDTEGPRWRHYPHLFKKLEWWEERTIEDMPEYVKVQNNGAIRRVVEHFHLRLFNACCIVENPQGTHKLFYSKLEPATLEDCTHYINQKQDK